MSKVSQIELPGGIGKRSEADNTVLVTSDEEYVPFGTSDCDKENSRTYQ